MYVCTYVCLYVRMYACVLNFLPLWWISKLLRECFCHRCLQLVQADCVFVRGASASCRWISYSWSVVDRTREAQMWQESPFVQVSTGALRMREPDISPWTFPSTFPWTITTTDIFPALFCRARIFPPLSRCKHEWSGLVINLIRVYRRPQKNKRAGI